MADHGRDRTRSPSKGGIPKTKSQKKNDKKKEKDSKKKEAERLLAEAAYSVSSESGAAETALALPEDSSTILVDMFNDLCRSVNSMTTTLQTINRRAPRDGCRLASGGKKHTINKGMDGIRAELKDQKEQVRAVVHQFSQLHLDTEKIPERHQRHDRLERRDQH
jgi:hypothetical protein